jgi:iron(III) transport system substrate-binding protein
MRKILGLAVAVTASVMLAACSSASAPAGGGGKGCSSGLVVDPTNTAALEAAAKCEGSVFLYGTPNENALKADAAAFTQEYGIKANYLRLNAAPMTTRIDQEVKAGKTSADVVLTADEAAAKKWSADGTLTKLASPAALIYTDSSATVQQLGQGLYYNSKAVTGAAVPKTFADLLKPQFKGKIMMGSPRVSPSYAELYLGILKDPKYGMSWFQKMAAQQPRIVDTDPQVPQAVTSGEADLGLVGLPQNAASAKKADPNTPLAFTYLDVITVSRSDVGVLAKAPHPNAALLFANWLMSSEGQAVHNGDNRSASPLGDMPGTLTMPAKDTLSPLTSVDVSAQYNDIIAMFDKLYK